MTRKNSKILGLIGWAGLVLSGCIGSAVVDNDFGEGYRLLVTDKNYSAAVDAFSRNLAKFPNYATAYGYRSSAYLHLNDYDRAIDDATKAIVLGPMEVIPWFPYAIRAQAYEQKKYQDLALADYTSAIANNYGLNGYAQRGMLYAKMNRYEEAFKDFDEVIRLDPSNAGAYYQRGLCSLQKGNYQGAADDFEHYLIGEPNHVGVLALQGQAYFKVGQTERARANVGRIVEQDPRLLRNFGGAGALDFYDADKRRQIVGQALKTAKAAEDGGDRLTAFRAYDSAYHWLPSDTELDKYDAQTIHAAFLRLYPSLAVKPALPDEAHRFEVQAVSFTQRQDYPRAIEAYRKVISAAPWGPNAYFNCALLEGEQRQYSQAISDMRNYLSLSPQASDAKAAQDKIYEWEALSKSTR
jgi:tetratricopeptide (TPR) repeat protein